MDSITAAKRLQRSYGELGRIFGGSFSTMTSAEQSSSLGSNSPSFICRFAVKGEEDEPVNGTETVKDQTAEGLRAPS